MICGHSAGNMYLQNKKKNRFDSETSSSAFHLDFTIIQWGTLILVDHTSLQKLQRKENALCVCIVARVAESMSLKWMIFGFEPLEMTNVRFLFWICPATEDIVRIKENERRKRDFFFLRFLISVPDVASVKNTNERKKLSENLQNSVRAILAEAFEQKEDSKDGTPRREDGVIDDTCPSLEEFTLNLESVLRHGIREKPEKKPAYTSWTANSRVSFFHYLEAIERLAPSQSGASAFMNDLRNLQKVKSLDGKGRAWIRKALNEKKLEEFLQILLISSTQHTKNWFSAGSFLCNHSDSQFLLSLFISLNVVEFKLVVDNSTLDIIEPSDLKPKNELTASQNQRKVVKKKKAKSKTIVSIAGPSEADSSSIMSSSPSNATLSLSSSSSSIPIASPLSNSSPSNSPSPSSPSSSSPSDSVSGSPVKVRQQEEVEELKKKELEEQKKRIEEERIKKEEEQKLIEQEMEKKRKQQEEDERNKKREEEERRKKEEEEKKRRDMEQIKALMKQQLLSESQQNLQQQQQQQEDEKRKKAEEQKRKEEEQRKKEEELRLKQAKEDEERKKQIQADEQRRRTEQQLQQEEQNKRKEEELEARRKEEERRRIDEAEQKRRQEEERRREEEKKEAEKKQKEEEERRKQLEIQQQQEKQRMEEKLRELARKRQEDEIRQKHEELLRIQEQKRRDEELQRRREEEKKQAEKKKENELNMTKEEVAKREADRKKREELRMKLEVEQMKRAMHSLIFSELSSSSLNESENSLVQQLQPKSMVAEGLKKAEEEKKKEEDAMRSLEAERKRKYLEEMERRKKQEEDLKRRIEEEKKRQEEDRERRLREEEEKKKLIEEARTKMLHSIHSEDEDDAEVESWIQKIKQTSTLDPSPSPINGIGTSAVEDDEEDQEKKQTARHVFRDRLPEMSSSSSSSLTSSPPPSSIAPFAMSPTNQLQTSASLPNNSSISSTRQSLPLSSVKSVDDSSVSSRSSGTSNKYSKYVANDSDTSPTTNSTSAALANRRSLPVSGEEFGQKKSTSRSAASKTMNSAATNILSNSRQVSSVPRERGATAQPGSAQRGAMDQRKPRRARSVSEQIDRRVQVIFFQGCCLRRLICTCKCRRHQEDGDCTLKSTTRGP